MKSVSTRLLAVMLAVLVVGMGLTAVIGNVLAGGAIQEQSFGRVSESAAYCSEQIEAWVTEQVSYTNSLAIGFSSLDDISPGALLPALIDHADHNEDYFAVYVGYPDGVGVFNDEWEPDYSEWKANERDWYRGAAANTGKTYITELYKDAETGNFCLTFSRTLMRGGKLAGVVAIDIFTNVLIGLVNKSDAGQGSYSFLTDSSGNIMVHPKEAYNPAVDKNDDTVFQNLATIEGGLYATLTGSEVRNGGTIRLPGTDGAARYYTAHAVPSTGWYLYTAIASSVVDAPLNNQIIAAVVVFVAVLLCAGTIVFFSIRSLIVRPVGDVTAAASLLTRGELEVRLDGRYTGEIALLADSFRAVVDATRDQSAVMQSIAGGDYSMTVPVRSSGDVMSMAINHMLESTNDTLHSISLSGSQVLSGAKQIADGAQSLAQGSTEQAAAVEQLSNSMSVIADKTQANAEKASSAARLAGSIMQSAERGSAQMDEMMAAVGQINDASRSIGKVIKVIDEIAFKTNILAINASIEAAHAGQQGQGFAVVAGEVRTLAEQSAEAAKETQMLIENSAEKATLGERIARETALSLAEIVSGINESTAIVGEIALSSEEQSQGIRQINTGIDQVAQVIQQNSATAEESAAASEELSGQADALEGLIEQFRLRD